MRPLSKPYATKQNYELAVKYRVCGRFNRKSGDKRRVARDFFTGLWGFESSLTPSRVLDGNCVKTIESAVGGILGKG